MKHTGTTTLAGLIIGLVLVSHAHAQKPMHGRGMMHGGSMMMMGNDSSASMPMMGMGMMGGMMMPRQIIAVDDGIIVALGNKLIKYDKDLNKKKEVTLDLDEEGINAMMEHMQRMHSTYQSMMAPAKDTKKK